MKLIGNTEVAYAITCLQFVCFMTFVLVVRSSEYIVFDAAIDPDSLPDVSPSQRIYRYHFDESLSDPFALRMLSVTAESGKVFLRNYSNICSDYTILPNNKSLVVVLVTTIMELVTGVESHMWLYFCFTILGNGCGYGKLMQSNNVLRSGDFTFSVTVDTMLIESQMTVRSRCIPVDTEVISLEQFMPASIKSSCGIMYKFGEPNGQFFVDSASGDIWAMTNNCLVEPTYAFHIETSLHCDDSASSHTLLLSQSFILNLQLSINVKLLHDVNNVETARIRRAPSTNSAPQFLESRYVEHVLEEQPPGYVVGVVSATDSDSGKSGKLTYSLLAIKDRRSQDMFSIDPDTGTVTTTQMLDRESIPAHYFKVVAQDGGRPVRSGETQLTVVVEDINDHTPQFESDIYEKSVSEGVAIGTTIQNVRATDEDWERNGEIVYSFVNVGEDIGVFDVDPQLGSITTVSALDREVTATYRLVVAAVDNSLDVAERRTATTVVVVTVLDENDNKPQFENATYEVDVPEDVDSRTSPVIARMRATDRDEGLNGVVKYSITGWNYGGTFEIDSSTGDLSVASPLDFESTRQYHLTVRAQDSGTPPAANTTSVVVKVVDVNDKVPRFYTPIYQSSVAEDVAVGTTVVRVQAYDADSGPNGRITYGIFDGLPDMALTVDPDTGAVYTTAALDRESVARYSFHVEAADAGSPAHTATAAVEITVRDVNDNSPVFDPKVYRETVSEEAVPGAPVVVVTAVDADDNENGRVSYAIESGNERASFHIISQMGYGLISVARPLSHRQQANYTLGVVATDGWHRDEAVVYVAVAGANLHRPVFRGTPYHFRVPEDAAVGLAVFNVSAVDADTGDNARLTYTMVDNDAFRVDPATGDIIITTPLDREQVPGYTLTVTATDHGRPAKSDTADIDVVVVDVNDNAPKFLLPSYSAHVSEDALVGVSVLTIAAVDEDVGLNGRIRYAFDGDVDDFLVDPTLGVIRTKNELDRERVGRYQLTALAKDRGLPERVTPVQVIIDVDDVNDNAPQFETSRVTLFIFENSPIGSVVGTLTAHDADVGQNAVVEYKIVGGPDADDFELTTLSNGSVIVTSLIELDFEAEKHDYVIHVQARSLHLLSVAVVNIRVEDRNDNAPVLSNFVIIFNNYKNHFHGGLIGRVPAYDPDASDRLWYRFMRGNEAKLLHLDGDSGAIRLDSRLNSDMQTNGTLEISVTDGVNEVTAVCRLYVRLITDDMLANSVTVRLDNINRDAFLSPLYHLFVSAVAGVVPTTEDSIFVVSLLDDTEVVGRHILNVTLAVRRVVDRAGRDVFYSARFLRERVYLQRQLLAKLSMLEVLPFDDNLCINEPCLNFEHCVSEQRFGNASNVVGTGEVMFRPLHMSSTITCRCPDGFTGMQSEYLCDTEVNLCYSNPCGANGTCVQREGGYLCLCPSGVTGAHCEVDLSHNCSHDTCVGGARCVPLIRGGFRCELCRRGVAGRHAAPSSCVECDSVDERSPFCELLSRGFTRRGSFLMFPPLKQRHRFHIKLSFATRERNGVLFYNGRYNEKHDFVALQLVDDHVEFAFSLGADVTRVAAFALPGVQLSDGHWHQVTVNYLNRTATVSVGEECDVELSVRYGSKIGNYTCAGRDTQQLDPRCQDVTETCHRFLDLTGPFQLGGLSSGYYSAGKHRVVHTSSFVGCIRDLYIDGRMVDLSTYVWNNGTVEGCAAKAKFCQSSPCHNSGNCSEVWNGYRCECKEGWTGKDCSQSVSGTSWKLQGDGYIMFAESHGLANVRLPWLNSLLFRTRQSSAVLMSVDVGVGPQHVLVIQLDHGVLQYAVSSHVISLSSTIVSDGKWHCVQVRWTSTELVIDVDYGLAQVTKPMTESIVGQTVGRIVVGAREATSGHVRDGFVGCVKEMHVGTGRGVLLSDPDTHNAAVGCNVTDPCETRGEFLCPKDRSTCVSSWNATSCLCRPGHIGIECNKICDIYNPCHEGALECAALDNSSDGYICRCDEHHTGRYCEQSVNQTCPSSWWGSPICGPCNCPKDRGFDPSCDKQTGQCNCRVYHYRVDDTCYPCDCYDVGSHGRSCNISTGQCHCRSGVIGRRCDVCASRFAEVTLRGCEVVYDACPRSFYSGIWWKRTPFGSLARQDCPRRASGTAVRLCNGTVDGWLEPDLSDCISDAFVNLKSQLLAVERQQLEINTFVAKSIMFHLNEATNATLYPAVLHDNDIDVTSRLVIHVLRYESLQSGLNLTHTQDRNFVQHVANSIGRVLDLRSREAWHRILLVQPQALVDLMSAVEKYTGVLARNMPQTFTQPFDAVHDNIVIGLDFVAVTNIMSIPVPKYNNKVQNPDIFDKSTRVVLPRSMLQMPTSSASVSKRIFAGNRLAAVTGYALYRTLGELMTPTKTSRLNSEVPVVVNSAVFSLSVINGTSLKNIHVTEPVTFHFRQLLSAGRSNPRCVSWIHSEGSLDGYWSEEGCELISRYEQSQYRYAECRCMHLSTFALLMDLSDDDATLAKAFAMEVSTYSGLAVALFCLAVAFVLFWFVRGIDSNANSIRTNLVVSLFIANAAFVAGIDRTAPSFQVVCTLIAIILHYFFLCAFCWIFVESLHIYRRMTDIRDVNHGPMRFYYILGYVIPGIVVGLSIGLVTDGYGSRQSCWMRTGDLLIWSLAGPICFILIANVIIFIAAWYTSCQGHFRHADVDSSYLKYSLRAGLVLLPLMFLAAVFAFLSVNNADVIAFRYLFIAFTCLQSVFIIIAYIILSKEMKQQLHYVWYRMHTSASTDVSDKAKCIRQESRYSSAMSFEPGMHPRRHSSSSSGHSFSQVATSHPHDSFRHSHHRHRPTLSPSASKKHPSGSPRVGDAEVEETRRKRRTGDESSDSDVSQEPREELASSHSSDDDEFDEQDVRGDWSKTSARPPDSHGKHHVTSPRRQHRMPRGPSAKHSPSAARHAKRNAGLVRSPSSSRQPAMAPSSKYSPHSSQQQPGSPLIAEPGVTVSPNGQRLAVKIETHKDNASSSSDSA